MRIHRWTEYDVNAFDDWDGTCDLCDRTVPPTEVWVVNDQDLGSPTRLLMNVLLVCATCTHDEPAIRQHLQQQSTEYATEHAERSAELRAMAKSAIVRMGE